MHLCESECIHKCVTKHTHVYINTYMHIDIYNRRVQGICLCVREEYSANVLINIHLGFTISHYSLIWNFKDKLSLRKIV